MPDTDRPFDADEADVIEQHQPVDIDDEDFVLPDELPLNDADVADALDQRAPVAVDDDDWPAGPNA